MREGLLCPVPSVGRVGEGLAELGQGGEGPQGPQAGLQVGGLGRWARGLSRGDSCDMLHAVGAGQGVWRGMITLQTAAWLSQARLRAHGRLSPAEVLVAWPVLSGPGGRKDKARG